MAKNLQENKAVTPDFDNVRPKAERIEGRDAGPGEKEVNFPTLGVTVVVPVETTDEEALAKAEKIHSEKSNAIENKSLNNKENNENA